MNYFWNGWQGESPQWKSYHEKKSCPKCPGYLQGIIFCSHLSELSQQGIGKATDVKSGGNSP
jgi:hypothetical protein